MSDPDLSVAGIVTTHAGTGWPGHKDGYAIAAEFFSPAGLALDLVNGALYVADQDNHCVRRISKGQVTTLAGTRKAGYKDGAAKQAMFNSPTGLALDAKGWVYVADRGNDRIRRVSW